MFAKFLKTAAAAAAITAMPVSAIAASPASSLSPSRAGASLQEESDQFEGVSQYLIPIVIVVVLGLGLYFALEDDEESVSA